MTERRRHLLVVVAGILILALAHASIYQREALLRDGQIVLLKLAPVDPRSLIQGDYMDLRFALSDRLREALDSKPAVDGRIVIQADTNRIGTLVRIDDDSPLSDGQLFMRFRVRNGNIRLATDAYFFEEGTGGIFARAQYGEFRVDADGDAILTHLRDADMQRFRDDGFG